MMAEASRLPPIVTNPTRKKKRKQHIWFSVEDNSSDLPRSERRIKNKEKVPISDCTLARKLDRRLRNKDAATISCISGRYVPYAFEICENCDSLSIYQSQEQIVTVETKRVADTGEDFPDGDGHIHVSHPTSYMDTLLHLFRGNIGSGLLAMGDAFKNGGIVFAPIVTTLMGIICVHAQHRLLSCSEKMQQRMKTNKPPGFADTVRLAFQYGPAQLQHLANPMKIIVNMFLCVTQLGFCCIYIVFIANNIKMVCDQYNVDIDLSIYMVIVIGPILLLCMVRNLKYLTPFSTVANILMAFGVGEVLYEASFELPPIQTRTYIGSWSQLPLYFGTAVYAFEGIGLVLPLKSEMSKPELFQKPLGVLNVGMVIVGAIFIVVGFFGYWKWGEEVAGSLTLNLEPEHTVSTIVRVMITLAMLFTFPLQFYVPVAITWPTIHRKYGQKSPVAVELGYRALLVLLTFILAESIPELGLFISFVGAVSSTALALIIPPLIDIISVYQKEEIKTSKWIKNIFMMLLGLYIFISGTFQSIASIVKTFQD